MRPRRLRRQVEESMMPTYELLLNPEEEARALTKTLENIEKGAKLMIKCTMAQEHFEDMVFIHKSSVIGNENGQSKTFIVDDFSRDHTGIYECGATRKKDKKYHSRQMRVGMKRDINSKMPKCTGEDADYCGLHGVCLMDGPRKFCHCDDGYMGETCDKVLMAAYEGTRFENIHSEHFPTTSVQFVTLSVSLLTAYLLISNVLFFTLPIKGVSAKMWKVVGGTTTSLNVICIIFALLFALLYFKEKKTTLRLRSQYEEEEKTEECGKCDAIYRETTVNNTQETEGNFTRNSFRKMRLAFRTRLNGTSDSKLLEK